MLKGEKGWNNYLDHIGLFFFFVALAFISLFLWVMNWICWRNKCCCFEFLHNPVNKRIAWWICLSFLIGILVCCISGCVSAVRFGWAIEGAWCGLDRLYYDSLNGQLKDTDPKWKGFQNAYEVLDNLTKFKNDIKNNENNINLPLEDFRYDECSLDGDNQVITEDYWEKAFEYVNRFNKILTSLNELKGSDTSLLTSLKEIFDDKSQNNFKTIKKNFLDDRLLYYAGVLIGCMKILALIYFCLFIIVITLSGVSMIFYVCLKQQEYLMTFMHVFLNIIRFFIFSFFIFGAAYGIFFLVLREAIAVINTVFDPNDFLKNPKNDLFPAEKDNQFLIACLNTTNYNFIDGLEAKKLKILLEDFFYNYQKLLELLNKKEDISVDTNTIGQECLKEIRKQFNEFLNSKPLCESIDCYGFPEISVLNGGLFGSFNCGFLHTDLNLIYRALYDASIESRVLAAVSLTAAFSGAIAVYFFLLVLYHYNNQLFLDTFQNIFTGMEGIGREITKPNNKDDPSQKIRQLRSEVQVTVKNNDDTNFNEK